MQAPKYDVQFLRSEAWRSSSSSSSSSSRTRQIKECKITNLVARWVRSWKNNDKVMLAYCKCEQRVKPETKNCAGVV